MRRFLTAAKLSLATLRHMRVGLNYANGLPTDATDAARAPEDGPNPLETYFDTLTEGPGIWKWRHYFQIYHRHLSKFIGRSPHVLEIGVYSGGSLPMWLDYFGEGTQVYGVDIEPACKAHERDGVGVFIGDQGDHRFWWDFLNQVPRLDVVIDDGSHQPDHQITSLSCLLPHMAHGGVYICEDAFDGFAQFHSFVDGLARPLSNIGHTDISPALPVHQQIASVHRYPMVAVIEKPDHPVEQFVSEKHGTVWQPGIYSESYD